MKQTTMVAVKAILEADPCRSESDRDEMRRLLGLADPIKSPVDRLLTFREAAARLGRGPRSVHHLARRGVLKKFRMPGSQRYSGVRASDIDALLAGKAVGQ